MTANRRKELVDDLLVTATSIPVRFADVDMLRVVHHSTYLHWFEQIRFQFLKNVLGITVDTLLHEQVACPVVSCGAEYIRAITFQDCAIGYGRVHTYPNATFSFDYWIYKQNDHPLLCATGFTKHCYVDRNLNLLLRVPQLFRDAFGSARASFPGCFSEGVSRQSAVEKLEEKS